MGVLGLSCSLAMNGNYVFCLRDFITCQKHSSLRSFALEPQKLGSRPQQKIKKALFREPFLFGCAGTRTQDQKIKSLLRYQRRHAPVVLNFQLVLWQLVSPESSAFALPYLSSDVTFSHLPVGRVPRTRSVKFSTKLY